jgi:hypothetical protein
MSSGQSADPSLSKRGSSKKRATGDSDEVRAIDHIDPALGAQAQDHHQARTSSSIDGDESLDLLGSRPVQASRCVTGASCHELFRDNDRFRPGCFLCHEGTEFRPFIVDPPSAFRFEHDEPVGLQEGLLSLPTSVTSIRCRLLVCLVRNVWWRSGL